MPQNPFTGKQPLGIVYNTSLSRPDAVLALAMLYNFEGKRDCRMTAIAVNDAGLEAAVFADILVQFYTFRGSTPLNSNRFLPVGLVAKDPLPPSPAMLKPAVERKNDKGEAAYTRTVKRVADTSEVAAMLRNCLTGVQNANGVMILSASAVDLDRAMNLTGAMEQIKTKLKLLIVVDPLAGKDPAALRRVLAAWPTPVVFCPRDSGDAIPYPADSIEKDFAWSSAHPVVDAYRAYRQMPYDAPTVDMAAALYAVKPDAGFFTLSAPGEITVSDDGKLAFEPQPGGKHKMMRIVEGKQPEILKIYTEAASAKPVVPTFGGRRAAAAATEPKKVEGAKPVVVAK